MDMEALETRTDLMLLSGVLAVCSDCAGEQILIPVDNSDEFCCTLCDAAVFLSDVSHTHTVHAHEARHVA
jgi:hypothetical protein